MCVCVCVSLYQIARVTDSKAGSSLCEASSSVFFSEGVPSGICSSGCERGLSVLLTRCSLRCRLTTKRTRKIVLKRKKESMRSVPDWSVYSRIGH